MLAGRVPGTTFMRAFELETAGATVRVQLVRNRSGKPADWKLAAKMGCTAVPEDCPVVDAPGIKVSMKQSDTGRHGACSL